MKPSEASAAAPGVGERFLTGIRMLDEQHALLFRLFDEIRAARARGSRADEVREIYVRLRDYFIVHFTIEEEIMHASGYPDAAKHVREHEEFRFRINRLCDDGEGGRAGLTSALVSDLERWIDGHLRGSDAALGEFLRRAGVR